LWHCLTENKQKLVQLSGMLNKYLIHACTSN
jgi:hypothetical protein